MQDHQKLKPKKIIFIGNYLPRQCGIATFTTDLCESVAKIKSPAVECFAIAMNDRAAGYLYPERVRFIMPSPMKKRWARRIKELMN